MAFLLRLRVSKILIKVLYFTYNNNKIMEVIMFFNTSNNTEANQTSHIATFECSKFTLAMALSSCNRSKLFAPKTHESINIFSI